MVDGASYIYTALYAMTATSTLDVGTHSVVNQQVSAFIQCRAQYVVTFACVKVWLESEHCTCMYSQLFSTTVCLPTAASDYSIMAIHVYRCNGGS